jgi:hypothetical protein
LFDKHFDVPQYAAVRTFLSLPHSLIKQHQHTTITQMAAASKQRHKAQRAPWITNSRLKQLSL